MQKIWQNVLKKRSPEKEISGFLRGIALFEDLSKSEVRDLSSFLHTRSHQPGEAIFRANDPGIGMYIIQKGEVKIITGTASGSVKLKGGDFFGEVALLEQDSIRFFGAEAITQVELIGLFRPDLEKLKKRYPYLASKVILRLSEILGKRIKLLSQAVDDYERRIEQFEQKDLEGIK